MVQNILSSCGLNIRKTSGTENNHNAHILLELTTQLNNSGLNAKSPQDVCSFLKFVNSVIGSSLCPHTMKILVFKEHGVSLPSGMF